MIIRIFIFFIIISIFFTIGATLDITTITFDEGFSHLFGESNVVRSEDDRSVKLLLDRSSGSGFISSDMYNHGFFSASIKLPGNYTAGIVVAFYTSNGDVFEKTHDELDFEFLGNIVGKPWRIQTNMYGHGSTNRGREERYFLPFDPTKEFHRYSILWTNHNIIFYIDDTPIREVRRSDAMGLDFPAKPMSLYATIWDASNWATSGGRYKVNYKYSPFVSEFKDLALIGCRTEIIEELPNTANCTESDAELIARDLTVITPERRRAMLEFRQRYMRYSFCYDRMRYPEPFPDCNIIEAEREQFKETGHLRYRGSARRTRRRNRVPATRKSSSAQAYM